MKPRLTAAVAVLALTMLCVTVAQASPGAPPAPGVSSTLPAGNADNSGSVDFTFSSAVGNTFRCALDSAPLGVCASTTSYDTLPEGAHTLTVVAVNPGAQAGPPATVAWTEDYTAPAAPAIDAPFAAVTSQTDATLTFSGEAGASFQCSFDGDTPATCTSPVTFPGLDDGTHELQVTQTDAAGNVSPIASRDWEVDTTPPDAPALDADVGALTAATSATFTFSGEPGASFQCALNGAPAVACASPFTVPGLTAGFYELVVAQTDVAGNAGDQAIYDWQVDPSAVSPLVTPPPAIVAPTAPTVSPPPVVATHAAPPPSVSVCASRRSVTVHWRVPAGQRTGSARVLIDGHLFATLKPSVRVAVINLGGRPKAEVHVVIQARATNGTRLQSARTYATCVAKRGVASTQTLVLHRVR